MRRHQESQEQDFQDAVRLGRENAECIENARQWCEHLRLTPKFSGLYAEMTGLPIGSHEIGCPYASGSMSMNLKWICTDFITENCIGCPYHKPAGDDSWGRQIIADHLEAKSRRERETQDRLERIQALRQELRDQSKEIGEQAEPESQRIISFLEAVFSNNSAERTEAAKLLAESARIGSDLFPTAAIDLIFTLAVADEFCDLVLPVCGELAARRDDLKSRSLDVALECLDRRLVPELAASVIVQLGDFVDFPLKPPHIATLLEFQNHNRPVGGWKEGEPSYAESTAVLVRCYDSAPESILQLVRQRLRQNDKYSRISLCGALQLIEEHRCSIILDLLSDMMASLALPEDHYYETASGKLVGLFAIAFRQAPERVDAYLRESMRRVRPAVQEDIVKVYRDQFFDRSASWEERRDRYNTDDVSEAERIAIGRLLEWMKEYQFETDIRSECLEALEMACRYATGAVLPEFDSLLGYYALVCAEAKPPDAPRRIVLPNEPKKAPVLEQLEALNRSQHWGFLKQRLRNCLEKLCESRPGIVCDAICNCFNNTSPRMSEEFRAGIVSLLGKLGSHFELQRQVLPLMMRALMDYGSTWIRGTAIDATKEMFRYSKSPPPSDVVDTVLVHLRDGKIAVRKSAVRTIQWNVGWLDETQAHEALQRLTVLLRVYRDDAYQLEDPCKTLLNIGRRHQRFSTDALRLVEAVFPTGEGLVDSSIAESLTYFCDPDEPLAARVACHIGTFLGEHERDRYNWYGHSERGRLFDWLHQLPPAKFEVSKSHLFGSATQLAARDAWESCHFASLFSWFGGHREEAEVLTTARDALPNEPRFDTFRSILTDLAAVASANAKLQHGRAGGVTEYSKGGGRLDV